VVIDDNGTEPTVTLSAVPATISENSGTAALTATLSGLSTQEVTVTIVYSGSANPLQPDFSIDTANIVIRPGNLSNHITITGIDDAVYEGDESIIANIETVTNATELGDQSATITIVDNETEPTVSLVRDNGTIAENGGTSTITATLSNLSTNDVVVTLEYTGTAEASGTDYTGATTITVSAGSLTGTTVITGVDDAIYEGNETIVADIINVSNGSEDGTQQININITDDETVPTLSLASNIVNLAEDGSAATLTFTLSNATSQEVNAILSYSGTAIEGAIDYTADPTIIIPPGDLTTTLAVTSIDDNIYEGNETIIIDIESVLNATEDGVQRETITIIDAESEPVVSLLPDPATIAEDGGVSTINAILNNATTTDVLVTIAYSGTATGGGVDYNAASTTITVSAGDTSGSTTITSIDDAIFESNETVIVDITNVTNATENGTQQEIITITDAESSPGVTMTASTSTILENGGTTTITATLSGIAASDVEITFANNGTTTSADYTIIPSTLVISAGNLTGSVTITAVDDDIYENDETIVLDMDVVTNATEVGTQQESITITDNDSEPTVSISASPLAINEDGDISTLTAALSNASNDSVVVSLTYSGTASGSGVDYTAATEITVLAGDLTADIEITAISDVIYEGDEVINVEISGVTNATEDGTQEETITILESESIPEVSISASPIAIAEDGGVSTITATLNTATISDVDVELALSGLATDGGTDYDISSSTITITSGTLSGTATITSVNDALYEGDEAIIIDVQNVTNATELGTQRDTVYINESMTTPTTKVTLSASHNTIAEDGGFSYITATLSKASSHDVEVLLAFSGTATGSGTDYDVTASTISIPAGSLTGSIFVNSLGDAEADDNETVIVDIIAVVNALEDGTQQETITISELMVVTPPDAILSASPATIDENSGSSTITAMLTEITNKDVEVTLAFSGSATENTDYTASSSTITIAAGKLIGSIILTSNNDSDYEGNETVIADIDAVTNANEQNNQQVTVIINESSTVPTTEITLSAMPLVIAEDGGISIITAELNEVSSKDVAVLLSFDGTAAITEDYLSSSSTILIPAGNSSASVTITAIKDAIEEASETVIVDVSAVVNAVEATSQQVTVTISDTIAITPASVTLSASPLTISEIGETSTITASLSNVINKDVEVIISLNGKATEGDDYNASSTIISIPSGSIEGSTSITAINDTDYEGDEIVLVDIDEVTNASELGTQQVEITIEESSPIPSTVVRLSADQLNILEEGGESEVTVALNQVSTKDVAVILEFSGTATGNGTDFTATSNAVMIPAGSRSGSITLTSVNDAVAEGNETIIVDIAAVVNAIEDGEEQVTVTILEYIEQPSVTLSVSNGYIEENGGTATVTATLSEILPQDVTVKLINTGDATEIDDFTIPSWYITIPSDSIKANLVVTSVDDYENDDDEIIQLEIDWVSNAIEYGEQFVQINIVDDEDPNFNYQPVAVTDTFEMLEGTQVNGNVLINDFDIETKKLIANTSFVQNPVYGTASILKDGTFNYVPGDTYHKYDIALYSVCDTGIPARCDTGVVVIVVNSLRTHGDCDNDGIINMLDDDVCREGDLFIPDAFSPNNDGDNDYFFIPEIAQYNKVTITVYNRWGNVVFEQENYENNWNGTSNKSLSMGSELPTGSYFYLLYIHDTKEQFTGCVYMNR
ncbi:MAG: gliding motility-associated C-terminal domain-containing protein, partial [Bacteroidales bacterium]|nr:gliding motility-associated C-terminal domain-containing protein [Bacteroidales bacterium]